MAQQALTREVLSRGYDKIAEEVRPALTLLVWRSVLILLLLRGAWALRNVRAAGRRRHLTLRHWLEPAVATLQGPGSGAT